jgi:hypothetical protein
MSSGRGSTGKSLWNGLRRRVLETGLKKVGIPIKSSSDKPAPTFEVIVMNPLVIGDTSKNIFRHWLKGLSVVNTVSMLMKEEYGDESLGEEEEGILRELLRGDTLDHFNTFRILEPFLREPRKLSKQLVCELDLSTRQILLADYYRLDEVIVKDLIGHKLSRKRMKRLKDLEKSKGIGVRSCERQFHNIARVYGVISQNRVLNVRPCITELIQYHFQLPEKLAREYTIVVFFVNNRFRILSTTGLLNSRRTLPILTWPDVRHLTRIVLKLCCNGVLTTRTEDENEHDNDSKNNTTAAATNKTTVKIPENKMSLRKQDSGLSVESSSGEDLRSDILGIRTDVQRIYRRICRHFDSKVKFQKTVQSVAKHLLKDDGERKKYEKRAATLLRGVLRFSDMIASSDVEIRRGLFENLLNNTFDPLYGIERDVDFDDHVAMVASMSKSLRAVRDNVNLEEISSLDVHVAKHMWFDLILSIESCFRYLITEVLQRREEQPSAYAKVSEKLRAKFFSLKNQGKEESSSASSDTGSVTVDIGAAKTSGKSITKKSEKGEK